MGPLVSRGPRPLGPLSFIVHTGPTTITLSVRRFKRVFISIGNSIDIAYGCGLKFAAVDAAFSKHSMYRDGCMHLLTTRDGDNKVLILAVAVCESESGDTYEWFAQQCIDAGIGRYLNKDAIIFSDRQKGLRNFHEAFDALVGRCFQHIIKNCRKAIQGSGETFQDKMAWLLQKAKTGPDYQKALADLRAQSGSAADYFEAIESPDEVFQYLLNGKAAPTHGHKTSNIVECANGVFVPARYHTPYRMLNKILKWQGRQFFERQQELEKWLAKGHFLTKYAFDKFRIQVEIAKRTNYEVTPAGNRIFYVQDQDRPDAEQYEVNLDKPQCCDYLKEHMQPCRHLVCVFVKQNMLGPNLRRARQTLEQYWPKCFHAAKVKALYADRGVRLPQIYLGKFKGPDDERILPPVQRPARAGRPKKKRYRYKPPTVRDVEQTRPDVFNPEYAAAIRYC